MSCRLEGAGNAFTLVCADEQPDLAFHPEDDGFIWLRQLTESPDAVAEMAFYNPDGALAALCGNGVRCAAHFLIEQGMQPPFSIRSGAGLHSIAVRDGLIGVEMPSPTSPVKIELDGYELYTTTVGVPHAYLLARDLSHHDLAELGAHFVSHAYFPEGTNFSLLTIGEDLELRTYERGVNRETLACGTAAVGAAAVAHRTSACVRAEGGELFVEDGWLYGPASALPSA